MSISNDERHKLQELVKQLRSHGVGGGSSALTAAMQAFGAFTTHQLAIELAQRLLGESTLNRDTIDPVLSVGGQGGAGICNGEHNWQPMAGSEYCLGCGISRRKSAT